MLGMNQGQLTSNVDSWYIVNMEYERIRNQVYLLNFHLVWCPKRRRSVLTGGIKDRLAEILAQVAVEQKVKILALEVMPDHLHLFVSCYPQIAIHKLVKAFKGRSSNMLRKEFPTLLRLPSLWTNSYFVSTAGNVSSETIKKYIEAQSKK
jgi:putative transposase